MSCLLFYYFTAPPSFNGRSRLIINNARKRDDGTYMCVAVNSAGERRALAAVRIKGQGHTKVIRIVISRNDDKMV